MYKGIRLPNKVGEFFYVCKQHSIKFRRLFSSKMGQKSYNII